MFAAVAASGVVAGLAGLVVPLPKAFLAMTASLALAFAVNRRPTSRWNRPALRRGLWIAAAAIMFAAVPNDVPRAGGVYARVYTTLDVAIALAVGISVVVLAIRILRGILADRDDRLLPGALGGLLLCAGLWFNGVPEHAVWWNYPFWILLGGAEARAAGNFRRN